MRVEDLARLWISYPKWISLQHTVIETEGGQLFKKCGEDYKVTTVVSA